MRKAIYPGTFDPVTYGHLDVIQRANKLFDRIVIGVAEHTPKNTLFTLEERLKMVQDEIAGFQNIEAKPFSGLLVNFAKNEGACSIIRGIRAVSDFEYEFQLSLMNKKLSPELETVFLMTSSDYLFLSSNIIKQVASLKGCIEGLAPKSVVKALYKKYKITMD
ncbi:MAG: pantetheine-phosphate adenylyltransferase [Bacillota bacterium]